VIKTMLPSGDVHILTGAGRIGKTTWLLQQLHEWDTSNSNPSTDQPPKPQKWAYINCNQTIAEVSQTLNRLNLLDWESPLYSLSELLDLNEELFIEHILKHPLFTDTKFFVVDGLHVLLPSAPHKRGELKHLSLWFAGLRQRCEAEGITILAVMPESEFKSSLMSFVGTVILMQPEHKVIISLRSGKTVEAVYKLDEHGKFLLQSSS
jgi:hypothetical protein